MAPSVEKSVQAIANVLEICVINRLLKRTRNRDKKHRVWVKTWVRRRDGQGCYNNLVKELVAEDAGNFRHFARLYPSLFDTPPSSLPTHCQTTYKLPRRYLPGRETRSDPEMFGNRYVALFFL